MYAETVVVGRLGRDPELRYTPTGVAVCTFNVAVDSGYTDKDGVKHGDTTWYKVTVWRKTAENAAQYLAKGSLVLVKGTCKARAYLDREGKPAASLELTGEVVKYLSRATEGDETVVSSSDTESGLTEEDIPF